MKIQSTIVLLFTASMIFMESFTNVSDKNGSNMFIHNPGDPDTTINNQPVIVKAFNLNIIPPSSGVRFFKDGIVYLGSSKSESKMTPSHLSFGKIDARYGVLKDTIIESSSLFSPSLSFPYPCEAVTFNSDFSTMYFTKYSLKDGAEKIYQANFSGGTGEQGVWTVDENPVSFCSDQSTYTHPALSADGKIMIFASNRTGSVGGLDLFVTQFKGGKWSDPVNLGDAVNSKSNELYPFLDTENNLYFSSDGIMGYGGYDIFVCKFKSDTWEKPINLASPVNTKFDDVAFTLDRKDGKSAFYTVKQEYGKGPVQLYRITLNRISSPGNVSTLSQYFTSPAISHIVMIVTEPAVQATDKKPETIKQKISASDNIIYRVQFMTSFNPRTRPQIALDGKDYNVFEYLYSGAYRLCVGEFSTISPAIELRNRLIQNDYPQATVIVFRNNVRSFDPELLEEQAVPGPVATVEKPVIEPETQARPAVKVTEEAKKEIPVPEVKKTEPVKPAVKEPETKKPEIAKTVITEPETRKVEPVKTAIPETVEKKDIVVYRVQIITSTSTKGSYKITINNKDYSTFEYNYAGAYRTCVGDYSTLTPAKELQNICRKYGYPQAFVVAFKNNVRSTDPALFK
ncbi:MAG: hypothetical protein MUC93_13730 [Bacteroidales bacterium]|jgi:hypothetical protein|nr:hypothetical protein [Bacteroidales bacterium]